VKFENGFPDFALASWRKISQKVSDADRSNLEKFLQRERCAQDEVHAVAETDGL
jgi:hypothetical protein